jgi:streptogramin lyase
MNRFAFLALVVTAGFSMTAHQAEADIYASLGNETVGDIKPDGTVSTFAATSGFPVGLAFDSSGNLFVANRSDSVQEFSPTGSLLSSFALVSGATVSAIAFGPSGNLYVSDNGLNNVNVYSPTGTFLDTFATLDSGPRGLVFDSSGDLFVATGSDSIIEYSSDGTVLRTITGHLDNTVQLVLDNAGNLYATNVGDDTIEKFSPTGIDLGTFATGTGNYTAGLAYDPTTQIFYQASLISGSIQEFSSAGVSLGYLDLGPKDAPVLLTIRPSAVPEPGSLNLMVTGLAGAGFYARRRRQRAATA